MVFLLSDGSQWPNWYICMDFQFIVKKKTKRPNPDGNSLIYPFVHFEPGGGGGGYLVQKTLRGCAANMGSKISLLVYEWTLIKCKIWYMNGLIFKSSPNLSQNWLKFKKILRKSGDFAQNLAKNWTIGIWMGHFFLKIGICMGLLSNSVAAHPYQNQTWVPPPGFWTALSLFFLSAHLSYFPYIFRNIFLF